MATRRAAALLRTASGVEDNSDAVGVILFFLLIILRRRSISSTCCVGVSGSTWTVSVRLWVSFWRFGDDGGVLVSCCSSVNDWSFLLREEFLELFFLTSDFDDDGLSCLLRCFCCLLIDVRSSFSCGGGGVGGLFVFVCCCVGCWLVDVWGA